MNGLWPDTAVEEANLTQNIFEVRKALGEVPGEQRFIATVARRGYRFVAEVRAIGDEPSARDDVPGTVEVGIVAERSNRARTWTRILDNHVWPDKPRWAPDGRTLYFISRGADGYFNLWGVPIDLARGAQGGMPFQITHFNSPSLRLDPNMSGADIDVASGTLALPMQRGSIWLLPGVSP